LPALANQPEVDLNDRAVAALKKGEYELSISLLEQALSIDPHYTVVLENLAIAHNNYGLHLRMTPRAGLVEMHKALWLIPDNVTTEQNMQGMIRLLGKNPTSFSDRVQLGDDAVKTGDLVGAIVEYMAATVIRSDPTIYIKLGDVLHMRGEEDNALVEYHEAALSGDTAEIEAKIGNVLEIKGEFENAIAAYGRAMKLDITSRGAIGGLLSAWTKVVAKVPSASDNHVGLGQAYQFNGDYAKAKAEYIEALNCAPDHHSAVAEKLLAALPSVAESAMICKYVNDGINFQERKMYQCAIAEYKQALDLDPNSAYIRLNIGTAYQGAEDFEAALKAYKEAQSIDPKNERAAQYIRSVTEEMQDAVYQKGSKDGQ
jgi:tetratricopeptide (TPR) repeat protein